MLLWSCVSLSLVWSSTCRLPWINHTIQAMGKRKVLYNIYKLNKTEADPARYKAQRNRVMTFFQESRIFSANSTIHMLWSFESLRKLNTYVHQSTIPTLLDGDSPSDSNQPKADFLNKFFFSCFNHQCPLSHSLSDEALDLLGFLQGLLCSEETVAVFLSSLDPSKPAGINGISEKNAPLLHLQHCL